MASCLRVANKRLQKAKYSWKENFDVVTDRDDMYDFLPPKKTRLGAPEIKQEHDRCSAKDPEIVNYIVYGMYKI